MYQKHTINGVDIQVSDLWQGRHQFIESMYKNVALDEQHKNLRYEQLLKMGVKLIHPNDGWVSRINGLPVNLLPCYPQFNFDPEVGDLIAIGSPSRIFNEQILICKVTNIRNTLLSGKQYSIEFIRYFPNRKSNKFKRSNLGILFRKIRIALKSRRTN